MLRASRGRGRLLKREGARRPRGPGDRHAADGVWEVTQHLIRAQEAGGEAAAAGLLRRVGAQADAARDLAYGSTASASGRSGPRRPSGTTRW